jgi:CBS domain-containing protein
MGRDVMENERGCDTPGSVLGHDADLRIPHWKGLAASRLAGKRVSADGAQDLGFDGGDVGNQRRNPERSEMGPKVADVMTQRPRAVTPQTSLTEVAEVMENEDVGAVPLVEGDRLVGIVTDRDIVVRAIAKGKDPRGMPASEVSSRELLTVSPDDDLSDALNVMAQHQVRRLAVTAEDDRLVGVVSQADVALQGKDKDTGQMVEGISRQPEGPRTP